MQQHNDIYASHYCNDEYCFPRRQLISSFGRRVIYHSKGLWEYIPKLILSVCPSVAITKFQWITELCFYPKSLMLYINGLVSQSSTNWLKAFFSNFNLIFELLADNRKIFKQIASHEYWSKCNVLCFWVRLDKLHKQMERKLLRCVFLTILIDWIIG